MFFIEFACVLLSMHVLYQVGRFFRGGSGIFFRRGCTRLLLYFNTNKPPFFFGRIPVVLKNRRSSQGGGVRTPCTLPLDPPLFFIDFVRCVIKFASVLLIQHASYLFCMVIIKHPSNYFKVCMILINLVRVLYQITFDIFIVLPFVCNYIYIFCNYLWKALMNVCIIEFCKHFIKFESVLLLSLHVLYWVCTMYY